MSIVLTAGHGGRDSGAVNGNITESHVATEMRNMVSFYLERKGLHVETDGEGHENLPLKKALRLISRSDLAIEFHCNSFYKPTAGGVEALAQPKDKTICKQLCDAVHRTMGIPVRGSQGGYKAENSGQHTRLAYVRKGGIILELFFISNPTELKKYQQKKWLIAKNIANVIYDHSGGSCIA